MGVLQRARWWRISQNQALFSIVGTTYGGDGPQHLRSAEYTVMSIGQGPGLSNYTLGQSSGSPEVTLTQNQIPSHNHTVSGIAGAQTTDYVAVPAANYWIGSRESSTGKPDVLFAAAPTPGQSFAQQVISISGGSVPHMNEQPYLGMNYCIALYGIFPTRN